jgi:SAM-dependent methyltransferase
VQRGWTDDQHCENWRRGLPDEMSYWVEALRNPPPDILERFDPRRSFRDLEAVLHLARGGKLRVLDVGAGPVTNLGFVHPSCLISIVAVDPLATEFLDLMERYGREPPVVTLRLDGERLTEVFARRSFDCAYITNALDHCYDPVRVLHNMFAVVRPGGAVSLQHFESEGQVEGYHGLHQWNIRVDRGDPVITDRTDTVVCNLRQEFAGAGELVTCQRSAVDVGGQQRSLCTLRFRLLRAASRPATASAPMPADAPSQQMAQE